MWLKSWWCHGWARLNIKPGLSSSPPGFYSRISPPCDFWRFESSPAKREMWGNDPLLTKVIHGGFLTSASRKSEKVSLLLTDWLFPFFFFFWYNDLRRDVWRTGGKLLSTALCGMCCNFFSAVLLLLMVQVYGFWLAAAALSARSSALYYCPESLPATFLL